MAFDYRLEQRRRIKVILEFCQWLYNLPWVVQLEESDNLFPIIESAHVLGITLMAGTLIIVDLRVLGAAFPREPVRLSCSWLHCC